MSEARTVLIVDDDPDARALLARSVGAATAAVVLLAGTVGDACRLMHDRHPDLVITDVVMLNGGGPAVAKEAERLHIPCKMVSSLPPLSREREATVVSKDDAARLAPLWLGPSKRNPEPNHWWHMSAHAVGVALAVVALLA